jgi:hypothetical protein
MSRGIGEIMGDLDFDFEDIGCDQDFKGERGLSYFVAFRCIVELLADIRDDIHAIVGEMTIAEFDGGDAQ